MMGITNNHNYMVRFSRDTFTRQYDSYGYVTNQLTKHDRVYDKIGAVFLGLLSRKSQSFASIFQQLQKIYPDVGADVLEKDLDEFIRDLAGDLFVVVGSDERHIAKSEPIFSYGLQSKNYKRSTRSFLSNDLPPGMVDTENFFYSHFNETPILFNLQMELTNRCNEHCQHCYLPADRQQATLDTNLAIDLLEQMAEIGSVSVTFSGGEPFLHEDISSILKQARKSDLMITVLSNATLLTDELVTVLSETNIAQLQISVYSMDPTKHDAVTCVAGSHARTMRSIEKLIGANVPIQISCPVSRINYSGYKDVLKWASDLDIKASSDYILIARSDCSTSNLEHRLTLNELDQLLHEILQYDSKYQDIIEEQTKAINDNILTLRQPDRSVCGVGINTLCVGANGFFFPCAGWYGLTVGDGNNEQLRDVWQFSSGLAQLRKVRWADFPKCLKCTDYDFCAMCLVRNFNESGGDIFTINSHFCEVARLNKRIVGKYLRMK